MTLDEQILIESMKEFAQESFELLENMESGLLEIQENGFTKDTINAIFRSVHTTKGSAGMFKLQHLAEFTHIAENLLDEIRNERIKIDEDILNLFLDVKDHMNTLVLFYVQNIAQEPTGNIVSVSESLIAQLKKYLDKDREKSTTMAIKEEIVEPSIPRHIKIIFGKNLFINGMDPANFIRYFNELANISNFSLDFHAIGTLENYQNECKLICSFDTSEAMTIGEIEEIFEFIKEDVILEISPIVVNKEIKNESIIESKQTQETPINIPKTNSLRVDSNKIDNIINILGEIVIANSTVVARANILRDAPLNEHLSTLSRMLEDIRESAMKVRMVQIGETFNKFKRTVHDISSKLNKDVELIISGGDTEVDKIVAEKISDPLVHIIRNAIDHGLESTQERLLKGKNKKGTIKLSATHEAGMIVIEISDDGKGLDEEKIYVKALQQGLISNEQILSQKEIFSLILEAGFSTAEAVTNLSGRGVGMDVVKKNIESLRGMIEINSAKDKGSTFTLRLPLTLAIIDGFLVKVGESYYVIPLEMIVECMELTQDLKDEMHTNNFINLRGKILPLLDLRDFCQVNRTDNKLSRDNIVVINFANNKFGLIVDELLGEFQTVIKPLGVIFKNIKGFSGATILGSGEVALILDLQVLLKYAYKK